MIFYYLKQYTIKYLRSSRQAVHPHRILNALSKKQIYFSRSHLLTQPYASLPLSLQVAY